MLFVNFFFVLGLDKNLLSISEIMKHNPHLNVFFSNNMRYIFNKHCKKLDGVGVEERGLFRLVCVG